MGEYSIQHLYNSELLDKVAIEYMKASVTAQTSFNQYELAHNSYAFAKIFLEIREQYVKPTWGEERTLA